jgi:hypothetical protein
VNVGVPPAGRDVASFDGVEEGSGYDPLMERTLDRIPFFDPRSRGFAVSAIVAPKHRRGYHWSCDVVLDQGSDGACVGFSWAAEGRAHPAVEPNVDDALASRIYHRARDLDGEDWPEGSSVLAGAKAVVEMGWLMEYRWAFSENDLALAVGYAGPAVLGINWRESMFRPVERSGEAWVDVAAPVAGGHAILCNGYSVRLDAYRLHNSWGADWGDNGEVWVHRDDMTELLADQGEACVPVRRVRIAG